MLLWALISGCTVPLVPCQTNADCVNVFGVGWTCSVEPGTCRAPATPASGTGSPTVPTDDLVPSPLTINEVLYDPSNEDAADTGAPLPGDANGDGGYVHDEDEFVELVNISGGTADITGFALWDEEAWGLGEPRHLVPSGTVLPPGGAIVIFGGGVPTGEFGGAIVQTATGGRLNLNNETDTLRITNEKGELALIFEIVPRSNNPNESYTRNPDIIGLFEQHADSTPLLFSPGTRVDGTPF